MDGVNYLTIRLEAVFDIVGYDFDPVIQLVTDGEKIGIVPPEAATAKLTTTVKQHKAELLHHFRALTKQQHKYDERLKTLYQLETILENLGYPDWKTDPAFLEWQNITSELSMMLKRIKTLLGRDVTPKEATNGFYANKETHNVS